MGTGITTANNANPLDEWKTRLNWLGSPEMSAAVRALLSGQAIATADGEFEITATPASGDRHQLSIVILGAPYVVDIQVSAVAPDERVADRDPRDPTPAPEKWRTTNGDRTTWELFNGRIHTLTTRSSQP